MSRINTNVSSLNAQKTLTRSNSQLQSTLSRLSTGFRINVGKDDPAGLIASEILRSDIVSTQRAVTNSERANQLIATADSALGQVSALLNDIRGLVSEAANTGALSDEQIQANQLQIDSSLESIDRIARVTSFQGRRLLDGSLDFLLSSPGSTLTTASAQVGSLSDAKAVGNVGSTSGTSAVTNLSGGTANTDLNFTYSAGFAGNNAEVVIISGAAASATYVGGTQTLTITVVSGTTTANDVIQFVSANASAAAVFSVANATGSTGSGAFTNAGSATYTLSGGRDRNQLVLSAVSAGAEYNVTIAFSAGAALSAGYASAAAGGTLSIVYVSGTTLASDVVSAINAGGLFNASLGSGTATSAKFTAADTKSAALAGGVDGNRFKISAGTAGTQFAGAKVVFTSGASAGAEAASYNSATRTITVQIADGVSTASQIVSAINSDLSGTFTASISSGSNGEGALAATGNSATFSGGLSVAKLSNINVDQANFGTQTSISVGVQIDRQATRGNLRYSGGTLGAALVLEVGGQEGFEVFNFGSGTSIDQIATAINTNSDATGVNATVSGTVLELNSTDYGAKAFVQVRSLNQATFETYDSGGSSSSRVTGTDVSARINGILARGEGLKASINTAALDVSVDISSLLVDGDSVSFSLTGGGANFQLGPDVVSNQQARLGIQGVNTATLGGFSGSLFELRSGGSKALAANATGAAQVVDEVITKVTGLRGRLGAFQRTTLETNIITLNDTLEALTDAESSIRDADFAGESARLTRAQILVQSGTSVLAIANQNPQNVLALLR